MNWTISVPEDSGIIRIQLRGGYDLSANTGLLKEIGDTLQAHPNSPLLFDNRGLDVSGITPNDMVVSNSMFADSTLGTSVRRIAILIGSDAEYERAVNWSRIAHTRSMTRISVFRDEAEAIGWLSGKN